MNDWKEMLINYWAEKLVRFSAETLAPLGLDPATQKELQEVGLPNIKIKFALNFDVMQPLQTINFKQEPYILLGTNTGYTDLGIYVAIKKTTGEIYQLQTGEDEVAYYMNANLKAFLLYMQVFDELMTRMQGISEDDYQLVKEEVVSTTVAKLQAVDAKALTGNDYYWPAMIIELENN